MLCAHGKLASGLYVLPLHPIRAKIGDCRFHGIVVLVIADAMDQAPGIVANILQRIANVMVAKLLLIIADIMPANMLLMIADVMPDSFKHFLVANIFLLGLGIL